VSDGAIPFRDNIDVARGYGVRSIAEPGGSLRSTEIIQACKDNGITLTQTGIRLFRH
jgi:phosphoribosylaminoimidazolecarboxamide formyltransferase/IMP cyclohydrolase